MRIAVDPNALTSADTRAVSAALARFADRRVLVHCDENVLASSFAFLYRVLDRREDPRRALNDVERLWLPRGSIREFMTLSLREHGIMFDAN